MKKSTNILFALFIAGSFCFTSCSGCQKKTGDDGTRVEKNNGPVTRDGYYEEGEEGDDQYESTDNRQSSDNQGTRGTGSSGGKQTNGNHRSSASDPSSPANQVTPSGSNGTGIFPGKTEGDTSGANSKNNARTVSPGGKGNSGMGRPY